MIKKSESQARGVQRRAYSVTEVAEVLGVSKTSVYRLIERGFFKPVRALRNLLIPAEQVEKFLSTGGGHQ